MIRLDNITFRYPVWQHGVRADLGSTTSIGGEIQKIGRRYYVEAIKNIDLTIETGSRVGIIGMNGSGKSTLLKICAGILPVSEGSVTIDGDVSTLFASTIFSNAHMSGRENIKLLGAMCGLKRQEIQRITEEVAEFSDLGAFLDMPMRTYSNGMKSRLGFGFATSLRRDIVLIDEVIGTGDIVFYQKAKDRVATMLDTASTIVMASHSMAVVRTFCDQVIWMKNGRVEAFGPIGPIADRYMAYVKETTEARRAASRGKIG